MHCVGLLQIIRFMQLPRDIPRLARKCMLRIFDPREQQIVGRLDGAAQVGNRSTFCVA